MVPQVGVEAEKEVATVPAPDLQEGGQLVPAPEPDARVRRSFTLAAVIAALSIGATVAAYIVVNHKGIGRTLHLSSAKSVQRNAFARMAEAYRVPAQRVRSVIVRH